MINSKKGGYLFLVLIMVSMAISPSFALGEGNRNLWLIGIMGISPVIILVYLRFDKLDLLLLLFLSTSAIFSSVLNPDTMRWSTVLYSIMFGLTFIAYKQLLRQKHFSVLNYYQLLKFLIFAYFIVLLIQQFCVLAGLPVFNASNHDATQPWKLNSLSAEPSHSARIVGLLMYSYISIRVRLLNRSYDLLKDSRKDKWVWIAFIWTMLTMGSATAILFVTIVFLKFLNYKNRRTVFVIVMTTVFLVGNLDVSGLKRAQKTIAATLTLDEIKILEADHSGAMRIAPIMVVAKRVGLTSVNDWFGNGVDFTSTFLSDNISGVAEGFTGGGVFQLWLEYGFICFALFICFSLFATYRKGDYLSLLFWLMLVFMYGVNNQIVWLCIILLYTSRYFIKEREIKL